LECKQGGRDLIKRHQLSNGLTLVVEKISSVRSVALGIWVKTGSRHERPELNGISHFIEHLLFKGTTTRSARDIAEAFDSIGGNINAFTSKEYTCYYAKVLDEHLDTALDILSDMFFNSVFEPSEVEKEKNVVIEEIRMYEDTPDDLVHDLLSSAAYGDHPLGSPISGTESVLENLTVEQIKEHISSHYTASNTVVAVAGNIDDQVIDKISRYFDSFQNKGINVQLTPPNYIGNIIYRSKSTEQSHICLGLPGLSFKDSNLYALILMNNSLGGSMSSRLFQEIREKRGLAYSVYSYHSAHEDSGLFAIYAGTAPKQTNEVLDVIQVLLNDLREKGLTATELVKAKEQLKGSIMLGLESTSSRMSRIGKNELLLGRHLSLDETISKIDAVTLEEVSGLCNKIFSQPFSISLIGPSDQSLQRFRRDELASDSN
jgi:predicted Zn-dependent peptidase